MSRDVVELVGEAVEDCVSHLHEALIKGRTSDAQEIGDALRDACAGYRDVVEAHKEEL